MKQYQLIYLNEVQPISALSTLRTHFGQRVRLLTLPLLLIEASKEEAESFLMDHQDSFDAMLHTLTVDHLQNLLDLIQKEPGATLLANAPLPKNRETHVVQFEYSGEYFEFRSDGELLTSAHELKPFDNLWACLWP